MSNMNYRLNRLEQSLVIKEEPSNLSAEEKIRLDELNQIWEYRELTEAEFKERARIIHKMVKGRNVAKNATGIADILHDARIRVETRDLRLKKEQEELK